jgi:uncharacterized protein with HEPN domain
MSASKNPAVRLAHIRDELSWVLPRFGDLSYEQFVADIVQVRAMERSLSIISEAVKALPDEMLAPYPQIPWHAVRGIGNLLRHEYEVVDHRAIWQTLTFSLPLLPVISELLAKHASPK